MCDQQKIFEKLKMVQNQNTIAELNQNAGVGLNQNTETEESSQQVKKTIKKQKRWTEDQKLHLYSLISKFLIFKR